MDLHNRIVEYLSNRGAHYCDARLERKYDLSIGIVNGEIRSVNRAYMEGIVIRVLIYDKWGYASTTDLSWDAVKSAGQKALRMARSIGKGKKKIELEATAITKNVKPPIQMDPRNIDLQEKIEAVLTMDNSQRNADKRVVNSNTMYSESIMEFQLANSLGGSLSWGEIRTRIGAYTIVAEQGKMQYAYQVKDGTYGFELIKDLDLEEEGTKVAKKAVELLSARKPPSDLMDVIMDPSVSGVLAHEVMGHASEADEIVKGRSFLTGIVGKTVGSELVTMVDDGTVRGGNGTIPFDSEGTPSSKTIIIEKGVYKGYMHSLETASIMGKKPTGNGRAQDFNRRVFVRMTNTFFEPGEWTLDEIIEDTKEGLLAMDMLGGMEDPVGGGFECRVLRGYYIRNGEKQYIVRGFTLTGKALEILKTVDATSKEFRLHGGRCGKGEEDIVYVGVGGPYMRAKILVGGG